MQISALVNVGPLSQPLMAKVLLRTEIRKYTNRRGPGELFSVLLGDETGEIKGCVFGRDNIAAAWMKCEAGAALKISGASLHLADSRYNLASNHFEVKLDIESGGSIDAWTEHINAKPKFSFKKIADLARVGTDGVLVDVIGVILSKVEPSDVRTSRGNVTKATLVIADKSKTTVSCTFWDKSVDQMADWSAGSILAIKGAKTSSFAGISLVCSTALCLLEPNDSEADELRDWVKTRGDLPIQDGLEAVASQHSGAQSGDEISITVPASVKRLRIRRGTCEKIVSLEDADSSSQLGSSLFPTQS